VESNGKKQNDRNESEHDTAKIVGELAVQRRSQGVRTPNLITGDTELREGTIGVVGGGRTVKGCEVNAGDLSGTESAHLSPREGQGAGPERSQSRHSSGEVG
jgi:hypothetical protein